MQSLFYSKSSIDFHVFTKIAFNFWSWRYFKQKYCATSAPFLLNIEINKIVNSFFFPVSLFVFSYFYGRAIPVWPGYFLTDTLKKKCNGEFKKKKVFLLHKVGPFPRLRWAELSCTGGLSTIQAPVLAETHAQEGARQGKRRRRRRKRKRRCWFSWLLSTFFRYGLLEGCRSLQVRALTAEGKAMKDKTKNKSTGQLPKKERLQFKEVVEMNWGKKKNGNNWQFATWMRAQLCTTSTRLVVSRAFIQHQELKISQE